jgi:glycosyltransferase involved in cell wall biosynthesis
VALVSEHASPLAPPGAPDAGGQNVYVAALATELARRGLDVVVHTRRDDPRLPRRVRLAPRVAVKHVDAGPPAHVPRDELLPLMDAFAAGLAHEWSREPPDVVHANYWMSGLAALAAGRSLGLPVVQTFHALGAVKRRHLGSLDPSPPERIAAERRLASEVDAVAATSAAEVEELRGLGATPRRIAVVPCGVDTALFTPSGPTEARGTRPRLVALGRLVDRKGIEDAVRALRLLSEVELVVAGGSGGRHDPEATALRAFVRRERVAAQVDFRGPIAHERVPALLRSADAVVCVPWYEPFGMVALESAACGTPVVATAVGGLRETVVDGATGLLVPPRAPDRLAAAVRTLLSDEELRARMGRAAAARASLYAWERVAAATVELYRAVVPSRPTRLAG